LDKDSKIVEIESESSNYEEVPDEDDKISDFSRLS
jgi:hypothetical protein